MPDGTWNINAGNGGPTGAASGSWNWSNTSCWVNGTVADGATYTAEVLRYFTSSGNYYCYIYIDVPSVTIGKLIYGQTLYRKLFYLLSNPIIFDNGINKPTLTVYGGLGAFPAGGAGLGNPRQENGSYISCDMQGSNGLTIIGGSNTYTGSDNSPPELMIVGGAKSITGVIDIGRVIVSTGGSGRFFTTDSYPSQSCDLFPAVSGFNFTDPDGTLALITNTNVTMPAVPITGSGSVLVRGRYNTVTFPPGTFTNFNNANARYGVGPYSQLRVDSGLAGVPTPSGEPATIALSDLPAKLCYWGRGGTGAGSGTAYQTPGYINYYGASEANYTTNFVILDSITHGVQVVQQYYFTHEGSGRLTINGGVTRYAYIASNGWPITWNLGGSNALDNELTGAISVASGGTLNVVKYGTGKWILSGNSGFGGSLSLNAGTLCAASDGALGASSAATSSLAAGTLLQFKNTVSVNKSGTAFTTAGCTLQNVSGDNAFNFASLTKNASFTVNVTLGSLNLAGSIVTGNAAQTLTVNGPGTIRFSGTGSNYVSSTIVSNPVLEVAKLSDFGVASSLGAPATGQATIQLTSTDSVTVNHFGTTTDTTNRPITWAGGADTTLTFNTNGSGTLTYSAAALTLSGAGAHTVTLGGTNTNNNTFGRTIADGASGVTTVTKSGTGTWFLTGSQTYTGKTYMNAGRIDFGASNRTLLNSLEVSGGLVTMTTGSTLTATAINFTGSATITAVMAGTTTLFVASGITQSSPVVIQPDAPSTGSNTFTGTATISGCVDIITPSSVNPASAGNGRVFGTSNTVTIASTGVVRTRNDPSITVQGGRARYHSLQFQDGGKLRIGFAA